MRTDALTPCSEVVVSSPAVPCPLGQLGDVAAERTGGDLRHALAASPEGPALTGGLSLVAYAAAISLL